MYSVFVLLLLLHCFIFILVLLLCCVYRSSLYCNIPSDLCTLCLFVITSLVITVVMLCSTLFRLVSLYLYCCYVVYPDHHFTVIYLQTCVLCVCLVIILHCSIFILVLLLCLYPDHHFTVYLQICSLCFSCYYFYIVLSVVMLCIQIITLL